MDLKSYREELAITKAEAARQLGVRWATYDGWEGGRGNPSLEAWADIKKWSGGKVTLSEVLATKSAVSEAA